jgi:hypothetical protein
MLGPLGNGGALGAIDYCGQLALTPKRLARTHGGAMIYFGL